MKLKIEGNAADLSSVKVTNAETGEQLKMVQEVKIRIGVDGEPPSVEIKLLDIEMDIEFHESVVKKVLPEPPDGTEQVIPAQ